MSTPTRPVPFEPRRWPSRSEGSWRISTGAIIHVKDKNTPTVWAEVMLTRNDLAWMLESIAAEIERGG